MPFLGHFRLQRNKTHKENVQSHTNYFLLVVSCFLPIRIQPFPIPCPLPSLNQLLSLKIPSFLHSPVTLSLRNTNGEPDEDNYAFNSNYNDDQLEANHKIIIAGDSLLQRIKSRKMTVSNIPSVKRAKEETIYLKWFLD